MFNNYYLHRRRLVLLVRGARGALLLPFEHDLPEAVLSWRLRPGWARSETIPACAEFPGGLQLGQRSFPLVGVPLLVHGEDRFRRRCLFGVKDLLGEKADLVDHGVLDGATVVVEIRLHGARHLVVGFSVVVLGHHFLPFHAF